MILFPRKVFSTPRIARLLSGALLLSACSGGGGSGGGGAPSGVGGLTVVDSVLAAEPSAPAQPAPSTPARTWRTDALVVQGTGLSDLDAESIAEIVRSRGLSFDIVTSADLDAMSVDELAQYGIILVGGGYGGTFSRSLAPETRDKLRVAVNERGVSYAGFCAGAFVAVGPAPEPGKQAEYGFAIAPGQVLDYFYPFKDGNDDTQTMVSVKLADGSSRDLVFWGGPATPEVPGGVIGRYSDGTPAITQLRAGNGFVTVSGPHPEAPQAWRDQLGLDDQDGLDFELAGEIIESTLRQKPLQAF